MSIDHDILDIANAPPDVADMIIAVDWKDASNLQLVQMKGRMVRNVLEAYGDLHRLTDDLYDADEWDQGPWD